MLDIISTMLLKEDHLRFILDIQIDLITFKNSKVRQLLIKRIDLISNNNFDVILPDAKFVK